jgi:serine/threonine protein phosphatase PrpC
MGRLIASALTDRGRVRQQNEDNWFADAHQGIFIVSDGMGGHAAGELASKAVVEVLPKILHQHLKEIQRFDDPEMTKRVLKMLSDLSAYVLQESRKYEHLSGMGATAVLALIQEAQALIAHLGDSRAYLFHQNKLTQLTTDHSLVQLLLDAGEITPEEAAIHPARSQITRYVGMKGEVIPAARMIEFVPGDRLLLCTDGLNRMLTDAAITQILREHPTPKDACRALIDEANAAGGEDNITVIVAGWLHSERT